MYRFTTRDMLCLMLVVGLAVGWWLTAEQLFKLRRKDHFNELLHQAAGIRVEYVEDGATMHGSHRGEPLSIPDP